MTQQQRPQSNTYEVTVEVKSIENPCPMGHKVGDKYIVTPRTPQGICLAAFQNLITPIRMLEVGGSYPMYPETDRYQCYCPDKGNQVLWEIKRGAKREGGRPRGGQ